MAQIVAGLPARAQATKIVLGYTAVTDFASAFVAAEQGFFKKRNLDVELKFIPLNSTIPAAIQADSLQIGGPTPSVYLQSVDGGLDQVVLGGGGQTSKTMTGIGLVARDERCDSIVEDAGRRGDQLCQLRRFDHFTAARASGSVSSTGRRAAASTPRLRWNPTTSAITSALAR